MWGLDYTKRHHRREIKGPHLNFSEIGGEYQVCHPKMSAKIEQLSSEASGMQTSAAKEMQTYVDIMHPKFFPSDCRYCSEGYLPMGLQPSDGVLLDQSRLKAPLSHGYYCPSYLLKIEAASLRRSILEAMATPDDGQSLPNTDNTSFNAGYAHHRSSWEKFILSVAIHEKRKDVVIVLNQRGEFIDLNCAQFQEQVLHSGLLALLKEKGYGNVVYDGETTGKQILQTEEGSRTLTVITRPRFTSADMKWMQLAAERLLGTGDNSALEAWCAKCILYLYEDVSNGGCKGRFLNQQVDLARQFSPALSQLLALFGGDSRLEERCLNQSLTGEKMRELEALLNDPSLADATLAFCKHICAHYSLDRVLEAALKRIAWLHCLPELAKVEANEMGEDFQTAFVSHVLHMNDESDDIVLPLPRFEEMGRKVREIVLRRDTL